MLEFFVRYDLLRFGLMGSTYGAFLWFCISYTIVRAHSDKPALEAIEFLIPMVFTSFLLNFFGVPQIISGIIVVAVLLISIKIDSKMPMGKWTINSLKILAIIFISGFSGMFGQAIFWFLVAWYFVEGEIKRRKNSKEKKEKRK